LHGKKNARRKKTAIHLDVNYTSRLIREILVKNEKPMVYLHLHCATLAQLAQKGMLNWSDEAISALEKNIHTALSSPEFVVLESRSTPETGSWALKKWDQQGILKGL
jgi:hypothetical protein